MKRRVAIDDFAKIRALGNLTISPSGEKVAFTVREGDLGNNKYKTDIWVYDEKHKPPLYRLTAGEDDGAPMFLDDDTVAFKADRKKRHQKDVFGSKTTYNRISLQGGEAEEMFFLPFAASSPAKLSDGKWLFAGKRDVTIPDPDTLKPSEKEKVKKELEEEKDYEVFDELPFWYDGSGITNKKRTGLFLFDPQKKKPTMLTERLFDLGGFTLNEDKTVLVFWGQDFETVRSRRSRLFIRDLKTGKVKEAALDGYRLRRIFFIGGELFALGTKGERMGSTQSDEIVKVTPDGSVSLFLKPEMDFGPVGSDIAASGSRQNLCDAFYFLQVKEYCSRYMKMDAKGGMTLLADDLPSISAAVGRADDIFFIGMENDRPQELYRKKNGVLKKLSSFNESYVKSRAIGETVHFTLRDREGTEFDGFVLLPPGYDPEKRYPGILAVHGGPRAAYGHGFYHERQFFAGKGYIVFFCNPPGGSGRGDDFADILGDKFGVRDYNAIMDFTDEVLRRFPAIDPERIGMTGGSYGGFMANWIIGHTDRFKAVVSCRSISNYLSKSLTTDVGYYHNLQQLKADPWKDPMSFWAHSPLAYADKVKTPTLFIQSDEDYRCWMGDAVQMLQALMMHGIPTRMCLFHGESHALSRTGKPKHRVRRLKEIAAWFDRYLTE